MSYFTPQGGLPAQTELLTDRAIVTEAYTVIPKGVLRDIVTSNLPGFTNTRRGSSPGRSPASRRRSRSSSSRSDPAAAPTGPSGRRASRASCS